MDDRALFFSLVVSGLTRRQAAVARSQAQFIACHPGRRAGKSWAIPRLALWACTRATGGDIVLGAETKLKAKALFWQALMFYVRGRPGWTINGSEGWIQSPWGPTIRLWGIKDDGAVALLRGFSVVECHFDEVATYAHRLEALLDDVIEPMLGEWRHFPGCGRCFLWGTPSHTRSGPWYEICGGELSGMWEVHHWDVRDNEHYPDPEGYLKGVRERHGWTEDNATYKREYLGLFVDDSTKLVIAYASTVFVDGPPPDYDPVEWEHTLAVDFGLRHNCAWALIGHDPRKPRAELYLLRTHAASGLLLDDASAITNDFMERNNVVQLIGDAHGLGAPYVEAWNRLALASRQMVPAQKADKRGWIDLLNDSLTSGHMRVVKDACLSWRDEASSLPWNDDRTEPASTHPDDSVMAALYAFRHHRVWLRLERTPPADRVSPQLAIERQLDEEALREQRRERKWYDR